MEFRIIFYRNKTSKSPIEEFLLELVQTNRELLVKTRAGIEKLSNKAYQHEPLSKYIEPGLWELRVKSKSNILRIIYTFTKGQIIILLHVFVKKSQKTPLLELEVARKRLRELKEREII